jgi:hypothetical protein
MSRRSFHRRDFLRTSAVAAAAGPVAPYFWTGRQARAESANDKLHVAAIGVGGRGSGIGHEAGGRANMIACCDVDRAHAEKFASRYAKCENTATTFRCELKFGNGSTMIVQHGPDNGIWFKGDQGEIFVNRGRITGKPVEQMTAKDKESAAIEVSKLYKGKEMRGHMQNFFDCVKDRGEPVSDVFSHHRELTSCHMCNIAMLLARRLRWDPEKEDFVGDQEASAMLRRPQREPYAIHK